MDGEDIFEKRERGEKGKKKASVPSHPSIFPPSSSSSCSFEFDTFLRFLQQSDTVTKIDLINQ